ncbi:hypothetical protein CR513_56950, partial [Mucuna pruriens]
MMQERDDFDDDVDVDVDVDEHSHLHNLSRLSVCTGSTLGIDDDDESFDADGELSDGKELPARVLSSDSDNELGSCYSLPSTPRGRRRNRVKEYGSDSGGRKKSDPRGGGGGKMSKRKEESDESGVMLITRAKGGNRSLCMDLEEVKACRDLGFELEHQRMLEIPSRLSFSNSTLDTSSGSNSPIANWRISSPGDDPRHVKARLKVWAQAVALVFSTRECWGLRWRSRFSSVQE